MKVLVTGATGLVGSELVTFLKKQGHDVYRLTRGKAHEAHDIVWDPARNLLPKGRIEGTEVVVHLAGENIAGKRWNPAVKNELRRSRVEGTRLLCETITQLETPPETLICASAIGFYGDRGSELLNETSSGERVFWQMSVANGKQRANPPERKGFALSICEPVSFSVKKEGPSQRCCLLSKWGSAGS